LWNDALVMGRIMMMGRRRWLRRLSIGCILVGILLLSSCATVAPRRVRDFDYEALSDAQPDDPVSNASVFLGTQWEVEHVHPVTGRRLFVVYFHRNGVLENRHANDASPANDRWSADSTGLTLYFNDSYAVYTAFIVDDSTVEGTAQNRGGDAWTWMACRKSP
jgi:hypothetical protein